MNVLLLSEVFPPQTGGSGRWFWEVYRRLPRERVFVAAGEYAHAAAFDETHDLRIERLSLSMPQWGLKHFPTLAQYWRLARRLQRIVRREKIEAVHVGRVLPEGWLGLMLHLWNKIPYTIYVHGEELSYADHSRELRWMMRRVFHRASRVIVNSSNTGSLLRSRWGLSEEKVQLLHPGVDTLRFKPPEVSFVPVPDSPLLLTVGRLQKRKGHDMLLRALPRIRQSFPRVRYQIIGDGEERVALETLGKELGVDDCVSFAGEISDAELIRSYQSCDLFALPNREVNGDFEGFGMVLLEAQACGRPVLAGDSGGTAETMKLGETGIIVDCTAPEPLADAVVKLLSDPARLEQMGHAARNWVVERFDWSALAAEAAGLFGLNAVPSKTSLQDELAYHAS